MTIAAPAQSGSYPERDADCEEALKADFEEIAAKAVRPGYPEEAVASELAETAGRLRGLMTAFGERAALLELEQALMLLAERATEAGWRMDEVMQALQNLAETNAARTRSG